MKLYWFAIGAIFALVTTAGFSQVNNAPRAMRLQSLSAADPSAVTQFNIYLPIRNQSALDKLLIDQTDPASPRYHQWLTPAQFKSQFGPSAADVAKVQNALESRGFTVVSEQAQSITVKGPVSAVEATFDTRLQQGKTPQGHMKYLNAEGRHLNLPAALASTGAIIPAFNAHVAHVHSERLAKALVRLTTTRAQTRLAASPQARLASSYGYFYATDLNEAYKLPSFRTQVRPLRHPRHAVQIAGVGANIGIVISSLISPADLDASFDSTVSSGSYADLQAYTANSNLPMPFISFRIIDGGSGPFNIGDDAASEASLDTQMSLGTAPGAQETLYDIPDLYDSSITDAYSAIDEDNSVDVVSSSFGECELDYTAAHNGGTDYTGILRTFHSLFQQGNAQGITFVASSGDNGALGCLSAAFENNPTDGTDYVTGVENPASDPDVTGVGGTNLTTSPDPTANDADYKTENADFDPRVPAEYLTGTDQIVSVGKNTWGSGGGFSSIFEKPFYQDLVNTGSFSKRSVPDVSLMMGGCPGDADLSVQDCTTLPRSSVLVFIGGAPYLLIGTSSAAPEFAGVLALAVELNGGRLGNINPYIYTLSALQTLLGGTHAPKAFQYFHREISGDNNFYKVKPGQAYSEVLGNSTLDVQNFLGLSYVSPAGTPSTPTNP
jgi:subtilase family serine protease